MTYKINDDQEVVIEATEEGQKEIKKDITFETVELSHDEILAMAEQD